MKKIFVNAKYCYHKLTKNAQGGQNGDIINS